ncbi:MAG TPA: phosphoheptose isomerase [Saprospiraceae bacterium]|nr:phosphoheptose isomerase [Saprospiraceae bacterium]
MSTFNEPDLRPQFDEEGHQASPLLPEHVKNFLVDIDGTICDDIPNEEPERMVDVLPYPDAIKVINQWYDQGHIITFFTSRTDVHKAITETWLKKWGFKYHFLLLNKPRGGNYHWIDNHIVRATRYEGKFTQQFVEVTTKVQVFKP